MDYIIPEIGKIKNKDLRPDHIQNLYNRQQDHGTGAYTIRKIHIVLSSALSHEAKLGLTNRNPTDVVIQPKEPINEMKILDQSQVSSLLIAARNHRLGALYHLAVSSGMRQMELLGLRWTDLDWSRKTIKVERQLHRGAKSGFTFNPPKTRNSRRTINLGDSTIEVLRTHFENQQNERLSAGNRWTEKDLIFTNRSGGPMDPRNLLRDFKKLLKASGLPDMRFHDLRHTAASLMLTHNIPPIIVSKRLGHAKPSITLDIYGHLIPSLQAEVAELIDELITPVEVSPIFRSSH